ncbi:hypothetical protein BDV11DRAFT_16852 [Aspergillus similis]
MEDEGGYHSDSIASATRLLHLSSSSEEIAWTKLAWARNWIARCRIAVVPSSAVATTTSSDPTTICCTVRPLKAAAATDLTALYILVIEYGDSLLFALMERCESLNLDPPLSFSRSRAHPLAGTCHSACQSTLITCRLPRSAPSLEHYCHCGAGRLILSVQSPTRLQ